MGEPLMWIEYRQRGDGEWIPFDVARGDHHYDVEWSKRYGSLYFDCVGFGGTDKFSVNRFTEPGIHAKLWISPDVRLVQSVERADGKWIKVPFPPDQLASMGYELIAEPLRPDPFADACEGDTQYCSICDDWLPTEGRMCDHVWWCGSLGWYVGPGFEKGDGTCDNEECDDCEKHRDRKAPGGGT